MNRMNFGNVITNGTQILSVGATTGSQVFRDRADSALTNMSKEERVQYGKYKADLIRDEMKDYNVKQSQKKLANAIEENSDQARAINQRISNDVDFWNKYNVRFSSKETGRMVKLEDILKQQNKEGGNE